MKKQICIALVVLATGIGLSAQTPVIIEDPDWLIPLRDAVYEQQLTANQIRPLYTAATAAAQERYSGTALDIALSRSEFYIGKVLQEEERDEEARSHFNEGMRLAIRALEASPSSDSWTLRAHHLAQLCSLGPWSFTVANGLDVGRFAERALEFNSRNATARHIIAARWIFAPSPFSNIRRGIQMLEDTLANADLTKEDLFSVYSSIGYGYVQQRRFDDARPWLLKALEIYPTSKYASDLLARRGR